MSEIGISPEPKRLPLISTSEVRCFRRCQQEHFFSYRLRVRPVKKAEALRFGTLVHSGLETWWQTVDLETTRATIHGGESDPYELAKADALLTGYHHRWKSEDLEVLAVEAQFETALVNPVTGRESMTYRLAGKIDAIVRLADGRCAVVEHKTSAEDIGGGSDYWRRLRLDAQISNYLTGAQALGFDATTCIYDVVKKPGSRPRMATPIEAREYTKPRDKACPECKKKSAPPAPHTVDGVECADGRVVTDPGGKLYANMRDTDEAPAEYRARILQDIGERPEEYFVRGEVARLADEREDAALDLWQTARMMRESEIGARHPRNPDACIRYGRACPYFDVCTGVASLEDPTRFRVAETNHEELTEEKAA